MKKYIKDFVIRGLMAMGGGPLVYGIVMFILYLCNVDTTVDGVTIFKSIISLSIMAFIIAGSSIVWQIDKLGLGFASLIHGSLLYVCYLIVYLLNNWIEKEIISFIVFTAIYIVTYTLIWLIVYLTEKHKAKKLNKSL